MYEYRNSYPDTVCLESIPSVVSIHVVFQPTRAQLDPAVNGTLPNGDTLQYLLHWLVRLPPLGFVKYIISFGPSTGLVALGVAKPVCKYRCPLACAVPAHIYHVIVRRSSRFLFPVLSVCVYGSAFLCRRYTSFICLNHVFSSHISDLQLLEPLRRLKTTIISSPSHHAPAVW